MTIRHSVRLALVLGLAVPAVAPAQQSQSAAPQKSAPSRTAPSLEGTGNPRVAPELANALDQFTLAQARRALQLSDEQYVRFVPRLEALQQVRRRNGQARHRILQDLRKMVGARAAAEPEEPAVRERLTALRDHDERAAAELRTAYAALDEVLDARQQARFRVLEDNLEGRKLELLMRARARATPRRP